MPDPFSQAATAFSEQVSAAALFFSGNNKALRLEAPDIALEFTDKAYIGTDPEGVLYFNGINDFAMTDGSGKAIIHSYTITSKKVNGTAYAIIGFHQGSDSKHLDSEPYAKFVSKDPNGVVLAAGMNNYSATGKWAPLVIASAAAVVEKHSTNSKVTITAPAIRKTGHWDSKGVLDHKTFTVKGNLFFKDIKTIGNGLFANYNNDRIVFYASDWNSTDFTAFVRPFTSFDFLLKSC
ncbi:hypothetical protein CVT26_008099 [Gymnopilus dilepis]|uniref:Uncharacterized protein n=1 Tax=Gymnopilus dilepis TaxID=231916 RepID=A0A409WF97_9AGAR|nr:hypothetical protein CVT26_008099 [Gymnopilus dilepis]